MPCPELFACLAQICGIAHRYLFGDDERDTAEFVRAYARDLRQRQRVAAPRP